MIRSIALTILLWLWLTAPGAAFAGTRRALVVGVPAPLGTQAPALTGVNHDTAAIIDYLSGQAGFSKTDITVLQGREATRARVVKALTDLAKQTQKQDQLLFYFSGYGAARAGEALQHKHLDLVLADSRGGTGHDLALAHIKLILLEPATSGASVTLIIDAGFRHMPPGRFPSKALDPNPRSPPVTPAPNQAGTAPRRLLCTTFGNHRAVDTPQGGAFTRTLLAGLNQHPPTVAYATLLDDWRTALAAYGMQPLLEGDVDQSVVPTIPQPSPNHHGGYWRITKVLDRLELEGPPNPGFSVGAELKVLAADNPSTTKGTLRITRLQGNRAIATIARAGKGNPVQIGDRAVLMLPGNDVFRLHYHVQSKGAAAVSPTFAGHLQQALAKTALGALVRPAAHGWDFQICEQADGTLSLIDNQNQTRFQVQAGLLASEQHAAGEIASRLSAFARIRGFTALKGDGGTHLQDNVTLRIRAVASPHHRLQCTRGNWPDQQVNQPQRIPLCFFWHVEVTLIDGPLATLAVGGILAGSDGSLHGFPADGARVLVQKGRSHVFEGDLYLSGPPFKQKGRLFVFGSMPDNHVNWTHLTTALQHGAKNAGSDLERLLRGYLARDDSTGKDGFYEENLWTLSQVSLEVIPNKDVSERDFFNALNAQ